MIHVQYNSMCVCVWAQELELVEDVWRGEAQDLLSQIAQLQEENKTLLTNMSMKDPMSEEELQRHEGKDVGLHQSKVLSSLKESLYVCFSWYTPVYKWLRMWMTYKSVALKHYYVLFTNMCVEMLLPSTQIFETKIESSQK